MPNFERHLFVCCNQRGPEHPRGSCGAKGATEIRAAFKAALKKHGLKGTVRANEAGCLDHCEHGPTIVVYPEQAWYGFVTVEDVDEIVESHLLHGRPVERLRLRPECINAANCPHRK